MSAKPSYLRYQVMELTARLGCAHPEEVFSHMQGSGYTFHQVRWALRNARSAGLLTTNGSPGLFRLPDTPPPPKVPKPRKPVPAPVASVWDLGNERDLVPVWPPAWEGESREYLLLGEDEEEAQAA